MNTEKLRLLRDALLDNAAGCPLASVHRNGLIALIDELDPRLPDGQLKPIGQGPQSKAAGQGPPEVPVVEILVEDIP